MNADYLMKHLSLKPMPGEGGFYTETYRSDEKIPSESLPGRYTSDKHFSTCIYYLLTPDTFSAIHRIPSDEIFHFYLGDPVQMQQLYPDGSGESIIIGNDIAQGHQPQVIVQRNIWQGLKLIEGGQFALMGTTVAPAFDFGDFEVGDRAMLQQNYSKHADIIEILTHP